MASAFICSLSKWLPGPKPLFGATIATSRSDPSLVSLYEQIVGLLAEVRIPVAFRAFLFYAISTVLGIDLKEIGSPLRSFATMNEFFSRKLKGGSRPISPDLAAVVSPADGKILKQGTIVPDTYSHEKPIKQQHVLRLKHCDVDLEKVFTPSTEAVGDSDTCWSYAVIYLAPSDYHRFHAPDTVRISRIAHEQGRRLPVNPLITLFFPLSHIYGSNEKVIIEGKIVSSGKRLALVAVGALAVGKIRILVKEGDIVERGEELGLFELGSSVLLLIEGNVVHSVNSSKRTKVGQPIFNFA